MSVNLTLGAAMFLTGAAGLIYEYVLSTVSTYLLGSSIEQFSLVIGVMFLMMGTGAWIQKWIRVALAEWFIATQLGLVLLGGFSPVAMQWMFASHPEQFELFRWLYIVVIGLLTGMEAPLVARIREPFEAGLKANLAHTWGMDYIGGFFGVLVWIGLLRNHMPLTHISFIVAGANLLVACITLAFFWRKGLLQWRLSGYGAVVATTCVVVATLVGWNQVDGWSRMAGQKLYDDPIIYQAMTPYQQIVLTKGAHPTNPYGANYELYLNGNKQFSSVDERIYHESLVHPAMSAAASRKNVLVLGGGDGLAMREILKYPDVENVTLVDLDPEMVKIARSNPVLSELNEHSFDDARVHATLTAPLGISDTGEKEEVRKTTDEPLETRCEQSSDVNREVNCSTIMKSEKIADVNIYSVDADKFVSQVSGPWDVVIVDLPDPNSVELAKLYSLEFYQKIRAQMSMDGVVVVQSTSPYHAKETYLCILRTMSAAGFGVTPYHINVPSFGDWGWVIGSPSLSSGEIRSVLGAIDTFQVETVEVDARVLQSMMVFGKRSLVSDSTSISTLMDPVVYGLYTYEGWKID